VIGIISKNTEISAAREFFQLFKTPWESYVPGHRYDLAITTTGEIPADMNAGVIAIYGSKSFHLDHGIGARINGTQSGTWVGFEGDEFPVYGDVSTFDPQGRTLLRTRGQQNVAGFEASSGAPLFVRIGYDLFQEVAFLLSKGQPAKNAHVPTLEFHISLLRGILLNAGTPFVEILPVPSGYDFMTCLTHDVDFTGIREHKFDSTMWGFLYRALVGSFVNFFQSKVSWSKCWKNWKAALSLPLVHLGWKEDFWLEFDRFKEIEKGLGSTFFFIPFKNRPGHRGSQSAPQRRAAKYDLFQMKEQVLDLVKNDCEVGLHGIDAWEDPKKALVERGRISEITQQPEIGIRMHWLYFDENSPKVLEEAGFSYDSTFGYNDAVGFRGGTAQVHRLALAENLLELPLSMQDTALFYPDRMDLTEAQAMDACRRLMQQIARFGGVLTINWHTRSLSPERLWGDFYGRLLEEIKKHRVWFTTAQEAVNWFRARRELNFEQVSFTADGLRLKVSGVAADAHRSFVLRVHHSKFNRSADAANARPGFTDIPWKGEAELTVLQPELSPI
jgi:hypothetical protein